MSDETANQLTLFAEDSLASLIVLPGSNEARQMTATSGLNIAALLPSSDPASWLARMFLVSEPPCSTRCYLTWKVWTTPQSRLVFQLSHSMPTTLDTEYFLWPTPQARDWKEGYNPRPHGHGQANIPQILGGSPNPNWLEWLMGFPIGWTDLGHSETP